MTECDNVKQVHDAAMSVSQYKQLKLAHCSHKLSSLLWTHYHSFKRSIKLIQLIQRNQILLHNSETSIRYALAVNEGIWNVQLSAYISHLAQLE